MGRKQDTKLTGLGTDIVGEKVIIPGERDGGMQSGNYNQTCLGPNLGNLSPVNNVEPEEVSFNPFLAVISIQECF